MGFFGFGKKKSDSPAKMPSPPAAGSSGTELPSIDSNLLDNSVLELDQSLDLPPVIDNPNATLIAQSNRPVSQNTFQQNNALNLNAPFQNTPLGNLEQESMYLPELESSDQIPKIDDSEILAPTAPIGMQGQMDLSQSSASNNDLNAQLSSQSSDQGISFSPVSPPEGMSGDYHEDLNKLFISDDWKDTDWNSYDPYTEEKIDEPAPKDFGISISENTSTQSNSNQFSLDNQVNNQINNQLPSNNNLASSTNFSDYNNDNISEPLGPIPTSINNKSKNSGFVKKPVELYIRGKAYAKVFTELDQINITLSKVDSRLPNCEDIWKKQEPLLNASRDQMEYLYRKLSSIDKKIFTN